MPKMRIVTWEELKAGVLSFFEDQRRINKAQMRVNRDLEGQIDNLQKRIEPLEQWRVKNTVAMVPKGRREK